MSNTAKAILAGVIAFAFALPVLVVVHSLTRSASIGESFGYLWNWITAALCGIVTGFYLMEQTQEAEIIPLS